MYYVVCQDCEDLLSITPPQSVKIQRYIEHLETEGITRVKMYMVITTAYLIFWAPLFLVSGNFREISLTPLINECHLKSKLLSISNIS